MRLNDLVKEIIEKNTISKQTEITDILFQKHNISVTQSNISRILKQINAVKIVDNNKKVVYEIQEKLTGDFKWIKKLVKKIEDNGNVIIVKSYPGSAGIVGQAIDESIDENIMGTIAGDNSLLIIPKDLSKISKLKNKVEDLLL